MRRPSLLPRPSLFPRALQVDIAIPEVFVAGLLGSMLVFLFSAFAITAVAATAPAVVAEVGHFPDWLVVRQAPLLPCLLGCAGRK